MKILERILFIAIPLMMVIIFLMHSCEAGADEFGSDGWHLDLAAGYEVTQGSWGVEAPIATIEVSYWQRGAFLAYQHQSLITEGWPFNHRGELTIDEIRYGGNLIRTGSFYLQGSVGAEILDAGFDSPILTVDFGYLIGAWRISLEAKARADDLQSNVAQIRTGYQF